MGRQGVGSAGFYRRLRAGALAPWARVLGPWALAAPLALAPVLGSCQTVPVTGRQQFNLASIEDDKRLGAEAYQQVLAQEKLKDHGPEYALAKRVVDRLVAVADDPGFEWEVHVIDDPATANAWCMPGGKIAVYTGILPLTQDETGLAVVLGHEIGHAIARHGTERLSAQGLLEQGLSLIALKYEDVAAYQQYIGVASNLFVFLPWGRKQELEADRIGLIYMARAGYDPERSIDFWQRMSAQGGGNAPPEFLSTHPSDETRIARLRELMPKALAEYRRTGAAP
jgi:predicted Zn-dependent protease